MPRGKEDWRCLKEICFLQGSNLKSFHSKDVPEYCDRANESQASLLQCSRASHLFERLNQQRRSKMSDILRLCLLVSGKIDRMQMPFFATVQRMCLQSEKDLTLELFSSHWTLWRGPWSRGQMDQLLPFSLPVDTILLLSAVNLNSRP